MLKGALAAAVTPLTGGGDTLDEDPFDPLVAFLEAAGLDGLLALGTTGEGILLAAGERRRAAELFVAARPAPWGLSPASRRRFPGRWRPRFAACRAPISSRCVTVSSNFLFMSPRSTCSEDAECRSARTCVGHYAP